jgi:hypothetical protein
VTKRILLTRPSPAYWRVTFDHPPLNIFDPETIPQLNEIITAFETDAQVKVVLFDLCPTPGQPGQDKGIDGARFSQAWRCRNEAGVPRGLAWPRRRLTMRTILVAAVSAAGLSAMVTIVAVGR